MTKFTLILRGGDAREVSAQDGQTLMEAIRDADGELLALCGGSCACATCHVYIDTRDVGTLPAMQAQENDLLECSAHRRSDSRLACQVLVEAGIDGLIVQIAPED
jgi:ferredoxin, 2Fe-2S